MYQYYHTASKGQIRTLETMEMNPGNTASNSLDVFEAHVKKKDVKHKGIQTETFENGNAVSNIVQEYSHMQGIGYIYGMGGFSGGG